MEMELLESSLSDWPLAPYDDKRDVDANWKRMVTFGLQPDNARALRLGVASHNVFDLAYAFTVARRNGVMDQVTFEMIEGMANPVRRAVAETGCDLLTYAPVAEDRHFITAVAYLIRRLDENTGPRNFLRHVNGLKTDSPAWRMLTERFRASVRRMPTLAAAPHRRQNRLTESFPRDRATGTGSGFRNEPNTDWSLAPNRAWAEAIRRRWMKRPGDVPVEVPLVVAGKEVTAGRRLLKTLDPSQLPDRVCVSRSALAAAVDVRRAVACAAEDPDGWRTLTARRRRRILAAAATEIRRARGDLIGATAATTGKLFTEADPEVSEAVDFAEFYPDGRASTEWRACAAAARASGSIVTPWNFPIAIPCGGITAALAAGNTVVFKPSSDAILVGWLLCRCFWKAGVPTTALQFLPCDGGGTGALLTGHPEVDFVILTGGTETGLRILQQRPELALAAETGGKNAMIVTAMSGPRAGGRRRRLFGLRQLRPEVLGRLAADPRARSLRGRGLPPAARGRRRDLHGRLGVGLHEQNGTAHAPAAQPADRGADRLEPGESWALEPKPAEGNPHLWSAGIKWGVRPGSATHRTEFFGPVLGVLPAADLEEAVRLANDTGYGLTAGLESLDRREHEFWKERIRAGNLYINRGTTGAVVLRQPFGGMGKSALGAGIKAGSPHYVSQFLDAEDAGAPATGPIETPPRSCAWRSAWSACSTPGGSGGGRGDAAGGPRDPQLPLPGGTRVRPAGRPRQPARPGQRAAPPAGRHRRRAAAPGGRPVRRRGAHRRRPSHRQPPARERTARTGRPGRALPPRPRGRPADRPGPGRARNRPESSSPRYPRSTASATRRRTACRRSSSRPPPRQGFYIARTRW